MDSLGLDLAIAEIELGEARVAARAVLAEVTMEITDGDVDLARYLAMRWLDGCTDAAGQPELDHQARVAEACTTPLARAVAWLNGTGPIGDGLRDEGVPEPVVRRVGLLNRNRTDVELVYYADVADDPVALEVMAAVIADRVAHLHLIEPAERREHHARRYARARVLLGLRP